MLRERDRLMGVIKEAKVARAKITQLNKTIAMFSDDNVTLLDDAKITRLPAKALKSRYTKVKCPKCRKEYLGPQGLGAHMRSAHGVKGKAKSTVRARKSRAS